MIESNSVFAEQSCFEEYSEKKGKYIGFNLNNEEVEKLKLYLLKHPNKDKDSRDIEFKIINEILLQLKKSPTEKIKVINEILIFENIKDNYIKSFLYFYLSFYLSDFSSLEIQVNCDKALKLLDKGKHFNLRTSIYSRKAGTYYRELNYENAIKYYVKSIASIKESNVLKSSLLNNLSLCYFKIKDYKKALKINYEALKVLKSSKKDFVNEHLFALLLANQGEIYFDLKNIDEAKKNLEYYLNFVLKHYEFREQAPKKLLSLYNVYTISKVKDNKEDIKNYLSRIKSDFSNIGLQIKACESLISIYKSENDSKELIKTLDISNQLRIKADSIKQKDFQIINSLLLNYSISEMKNKAIAEKQGLNTQIQLWITIIFLSIIIIGFITFLWHRSKAQKYEVNNLKRKKLAKEVALKEQKIGQLQQGLELKNSMNKIFVNNIKSLRNKKDVSVEQVLKELQLQLTKLVQIDKKNFDINDEINEDKQHFLQLLKEKHPNLTKVELQLCGYLRLDLSSKEIASLMNNTDGTIRVYKTKLKEKLGILKDSTIEEYLKIIIIEKED